MKTVTVSTTAELKAALAKAGSGDTILLASGTYSGVSIRDMKFDGNVTIASKNMNDPAVFTNLSVRGSENITFRGLEFASNPADGIYKFTISQSKDIVLDKLYVHGTLDGNPWDDTAALMIRDSKDVTVSNSEFEQQLHAISFLKVDGLTVVNNDIHDIRSDGVRGGGSSNVLVSGNSFTDFYPHPGKRADGMDKDHPDAIQFWTTNETKSAKNIVITDNVVTRGDGAAIQGIFMRDIEGKLPFENVTISGNTIIGGMANGIAVSHTKNAVITDNNVIAIGDDKSHIRLDYVSGKVTDNEATGYQYFNSGGVVQDANLVVEAMTAAQARDVADLQAKGGPALARTIDVHVDSVLELIAWSAPPSSSKTAAAVTFKEVVIQGTASIDRLHASAIGDSVVYGGAGNDALTGSTKGNHRLVGGEGNDSYTVRSTGDKVIEAANGGSDTVSTHIDFTLPDHVETLRMLVGDKVGRGNALDNRLIGSNGADELYGMAGEDLMQGGGGDDRMYGGDGADQLRGEAGHDRLDGGNGDDILSGSDGNDVLLGGAGNDLLEGGTGNDTMTGGAGVDRFRFRDGDVGKREVDIITDFQRGVDLIELSLIDANRKTAGDGRFSFIGTQNFSKAAGELGYKVVGNDAHVMGDLDGDGKADFTIVLQGVTLLSDNDFFL